MKTTSSVPMGRPIVPITLSDLVNTNFNNRLNKLEEVKDEVMTFRVIAPKNCKQMTIDLSKPDKPLVKYKVSKNSPRGHV